MTIERMSEIKERLETDVQQENAQLEAELRQIMAEVMQPYNAHINALIRQVDYLTGREKHLTNVVVALCNKLQLDANEIVILEDI